ncbi:Uma2 family endonuclease [Nocardia alba]|uniref:Uma2 family endonuclease n=1 Tax=Nocardia alba TaxID=225051 RepID=A0A4R1G667_9NOCA|nr:Uma2 family endonuclease [Nocardia alba]TCJ99211.1 Uma2 family endonuclease [Nocardia alba]
MSAEVSMIHPLGPKTVEDWLAEEQPVDGSRLELIWGYLHMTPPPGGPHQFASLELAIVLRDALRTAGRSDLCVLPAVGVRISTPFRIGVIPDIAVVTGGINHKTFAADVVALAVEIWSPGNTRAERDTKIAAYASARVPYLWVIELPEGKPARFWGYTLGESGYRQEVFATDGESVKAPGPVPVVVDTAQLR